MKKMTKKQRVEKYINRLMKGRYFTVDDLMSLTINDLKQDTPILDVGKSTILSVLNEYKKKYRGKTLNEFEANDKQPANRKAVSVNDIREKEIGKLDEVVAWFYEKGKRDILEFEELKDALTDAGIDYKRILGRYRNR